MRPSPFPRLTDLSRGALALRTTALVLVIAVTSVIVCSEPAGALPKIYEWSSQLTPLQQTMDGVSCAPATGDCTAVGESLSGPFIDGTTNGGTTWLPETVPSFTYDLGAVSCVSATTCVAVGGSTIVTTADGGGLWTHRASPGGADGSASSVSCVSTLCMAVGASANTETPWAIVSTDGGITWKQVVVPTQLRLYGISCASTTDCVAVGPDTILTTANGGSSWQARTEPASGYVYGVSCSGKLCMAAGTSYYTYAGFVIVSTDGGATWKGVPTVVTDALDAISCPTATTCIAVGLGQQPPTYQPPTSEITTDAGASWVTVPGVTSESWWEDATLSGVSCASALSCEAVGVDTNFGGQDVGVIGGLESYPDFVAPPSVRFVRAFAGSYNPLVVGQPIPAVTETGALPPGVTFTDGVFSGTPTRNGTYPVTLSAANILSPTGAPLNESFILTVEDYGIVPTVVPVAVRGQPFRLQLETGGSDGGAARWKKVGKLPKGLKLNRATGLLSGIPSLKLTQGYLSATIEVIVKTGKIRESATETLTIDVT